MPVAKKGFCGNYLCFICYVLVAVLVGGSLLGLQLRCMNNSQNSFVSGYCLSDNNSRAIVSAITTVAVSLMGVALVDCICSYRTSKLSTGIEEGVYIALGSMDYKYSLRCMRTRWWAVILLVLLLLYGPGAMQTLLSALISTVPVYVKTSSSTATVYDHTSYYNATDISVPPTTFATAFTILTQASQYGLGGNAVLDVGRSVSTTVLRQEFISVTDITDGDYTNAVRHTETSATVTTSCRPAQILTAAFATYIDSSSNVVIGEAASYAYNLNYETVSPNQLVFYTSLVLCQGCVLDSLVATPGQRAFSSACTTTVTLQDGGVIFTLGTQNVQKLDSSNATTVNAATFGELVANASISVEVATPTESLQQSLIYSEALQTVFGNTQQGLFNTSADNLLHSRICAASTWALNLLWTSYGAYLDSDGLPVNGNNYTLYDQDVPVYAIKQQAYMPTKVSAAFAVLIVLYLGCVCSVGAYFTKRAHINVKSVLENSFFGCVDRDSIDIMIAAGASNCEESQLRSAFTPGRLLYCSTDLVDIYHTGHPVERVKIGYYPALPGRKPVINTPYH